MIPRRLCTWNARVLIILTLVFSLSAFFLSNFVQAQNSAGKAFLETSRLISPPEGIRRNTKVLLTQDDDKPHLLAGSFYSLEDHLSTTLLLNNKGPNPLEVRPTLYNLSGTRLDIEPVTIDGNSFRLIDLHDWVASAGNSFRSGSIQLFHRGRDLVLGAQLYLVDAERSLSFEEKLVEIAKSDSTRLEGLWWLPSQHSQVQLVLSNTTDKTLSITAHLASTGPGGNESKQYELSAHETRVIEFPQQPAVNKPGTRASVGAVSLQHLGPRDALLARAMVRDNEMGYSTTVQFSNPRRGKSSQLHGAGLRLGRIADEELTPVVIARNVGDKPTILTGRVPFSTSDGSAGVVSVMQTHLAPGQIKLVDVHRSVRERTVPRNIETAGLEFEYTGTPGSVVMSAQSVSSGGNQVFRVPLWDPLAQRSPTGGYPWYIEGDSSTAIYIKNITDQPQHYVGRFTHSGGTYILGMKTIDPHQTVSVDLRALRDNQVPDYFEQLIPSTTSRGQFQWTLITGDESPESDPLKSLALIGRSEQVDIVRGISSNYACQNCCSDNVASVGIVPGNTVDSLNTTREFAAIEQRVDCYGQTYPVRITSNVTWSSSNTSVATINSLGVATTHNPGTTTISANWSRNGVMENPDQCDPQLGPSKEEPDVNPLLPACGTCLTFHGVMNPSVGYQVTSCAVTIEEETISPNNLPQDSVRNPARIRRLFAPVFEATVTGGSPSACPVSWVVAGPGQIVGTANNPLVTVNGNAVGDLLLKVTTFGGRFEDLIVPVVNQRDVDVRVWIVRSTDGTVSAATQTRINDEIAMANKIWEQCGVQFTLRSTSFLNSSTFLDPPDQATKDLLRNTNAATGGIEVYYVRNLLGEPSIVGSTNPTGVIVTAGANSRTLAHELGHAMGLPGNPHRPTATANVSLMHALFSATIADIVLGECTALSTFSSN